MALREIRIKKSEMSKIVIPGNPSGAKLSRQSTRAIKFEKRRLESSKGDENEKSMCDESNFKRCMSQL